MCIIAISDYKVPALTKEVLETCFYNNDDGAGFATWDAETREWVVEKGFLTFEDFWEAYEPHQFSEDDYVVCHFRIGSSGNKDAGNTHPFPIVANYLTMREPKFRSKNILFHNGVIGSGWGMYSDTMKHIMDVIAPLLPHFEERGIKEIAEELSHSTSNRWFITKESRIYMWGKWEKSDEGWEFSNSSYRYKKVTTVYQSSNHYGAGWGTGFADEDKWASYYNKDGEFDAKKWRKDIAKKQNITLPKEDDKGELKNGNVIVATEGNDYIYGLMNEDGEVIWDKLESEDKVVPEYLFCPECGGDKGLMENPYQGVGDTLCNNCGAVFDDASGKIHYYDKEYHDDYKKRQSTGRRKGSN